MADSKLFMIPFGASGDRAAIPNTVAPSGAVSWPQGFGPDYERDPATDPMAKRVPRDETNEYLYQITNAIKFLQLYGIPEWFSDDGNGSPVSYPLGAVVQIGGAAYVSISAANTSDPLTTPSKWVAGGRQPVKTTTVAFTSAGTFSFTAPVSGYYSVECYGAGGGAARRTGLTQGEGGGGGGYAKKSVYLTAGDIVPVVVGAGGVSTGGSVSDGTAGGGSSFGSFCSATGGGGGTAAGAPGSGGSGVSGDLNLSGQTGLNGVDGIILACGGKGAGPLGGGGALSGNGAQSPGGGGGLMASPSGVDWISDGATGAVIIEY